MKWYLMLKEMDDLLFVWCVVKYVKLNVIVFCGNGMMFGVGVG